MLGENRFALWTEQSITFAGQSVQRTTPTSPPLPIAQNSTKISIDNRKSIMLCNKLTHTHPLGCISPDKRSGVSTTEPFAPGSETRKMSPWPGPLCLSQPGKWEGGQSSPHQGSPSVQGGEDTNAVTRCRLLLHTHVGRGPWGSALPACQDKL